MQATTTTLHSSSFLFLPPKPSLLLHSQGRVRTSTRIRAAKRDSSDQKNGRSCVDEDMIMLRLRLQELKREEDNHSPPSNWMKWEKKYYAYYYSDICEAVGLLQNQLMNTRPSLALAMGVILALSVATSTVMAMSSFLEIVKLLLSWIHIC